MGMKETERNRGHIKSPGKELGIPISVSEKMNSKGLA